MGLKENLFLFTILFGVTMQTKNYEIIKLIGDFIEKSNVPTKISSYVCWSKEDQLLFWKNLFLKNVPCQIGTIGNNITILFPPQQQLFLLDMNCDGFEKVLRKGKQLNLFNHPYRWIIWGQTDINKFKQFYFRLDSKIFLIEKYKKSGYRIKSYYKICKDSSEFVENNIAEWDVKRGFIVFNVLTFSKNRTNLMRTNLNISYVITNLDTYDHLEDFRNSHIDTVTKLNWMIMKCLLTILNATETQIFRTSWGYKDGNSTRYIGMIGDMQDDMAEIGGTALFFTTDRIDVIDYVAPSVPTLLKFIFRAPPLAYVSNVFTLPFETYVWYCCFGLVPLIFIVVYLIVKWEWRDPMFIRRIAERKANGIVPLRSGFFDVLVMELGAITQQGTDTEPQSNAGRIATVFAFTAFMFLYTAYSANIVAILQSTTESIKTLEDLLNSRISMGAEDVPYERYFLKDTEEPIRKAIYHQKLEPKGQKSNFMAAEEGISRVQKEFFAFHIQTSSGYKIIEGTFQESEKCSLKEISFINLTETWVSIKKRSAYKEIIKVGLIKILETGVQRRFINRLYTKKPICQSKGSNFGSASILDCYAAFLLFGIGIGFSIVMLLLEILINKKKKQRNFSLNNVKIPPEDDE